MGFVNTLMNSQIPQKRSSLPYKYQMLKNQLTWNSNDTEP